jgi:hypothetical protein
MVGSIDNKILPVVDGTEQQTVSVTGKPRMRLLINDSEMITFRPDSSRVDRMMP